MSILFALALAAAPAQPVAAAAADKQHAQHAKHQEQMRKHHKECEDMMAKMHKGMNHESRGATEKAGEHSQGSHH